MGKEIERKFLVRSDQFKQEAVSATLYRQGYIPTTNGMTVRIRIAGEQGFVTLKNRSVGFTRSEFEYPIPLDDARQMLELMCEKPQIEKHRYVVPASYKDAGNDASLKTSACDNASLKTSACDNASSISIENSVSNQDTSHPSADGNTRPALKWEVDVFHGDNEGLVVAEIEVPDEATQFDLPAWIGEEVTGIKKYNNSYLCRNPYKDWEKE